MIAAILETNALQEQKKKGLDPFFECRKVIPSFFLNLGTVFIHYHGAPDQLFHLSTSGNLKWCILYMLFLQKPLAQLLHIIPLDL